MFDKTRDQTHNWRWDNLLSYGDQDDRSNMRTTNPGNVYRTGKRFLWYGSNDHSANIEPPRCRQYKPGDFMPVRQLNWDEIIHENDDDENCADPGAPHSGSSHAGDDNNNDDGEGDEGTQRGEIGTGEGKGTTDGNGKMNGNGKGKENGKGKGIVKQTPGGDEISCAVALQLQKEMSELDLATEGKLERL